jgi:UDP-2,4-diacetamido-2,4,6-trideoxy-beta-L-altropyranose hydrolase
MNPNNTVFVLADARPGVGLGHLYRCLNLAEVLSRDFPVTFLLEDAPAAFFDRLRSAGIERNPRLEAAREITNQIIIIDGYDYPEWLYAVAARNGNLVVAIDDLAEKFFDADILVSHGPQHRLEDFQVAPRCRLLLGPDYALINSCFYGLGYAFRPEIRRLFVGFGGSDPTDATAAVATAISGLETELHVVLGPGYGDADRIRALIPAARVYENLSQARLAALMRETDAAIAPPSSMSLELCAVGVPSLLFVVADNQEPFGKALCSLGLAHFAGRLPVVESERIRATTDAFLRDANARCKARERCRAVFQSSGVSRVASVITDIVAAPKHRTRR